MRLHGQSTLDKGRLRDDRARVRNRDRCEAMGELAHIEDDSGLYSELRELLIKRRARAGADLTQLTGANMCLYNDAKFHGIPEIYSDDVGDGPFSVSHYNNNVRMSSRNSTSGAFLGVRCASSVGDLVQSQSPKFVYYVQPSGASASVGRFSQLNSTCLNARLQFPKTRNLQMSRRTSPHSIR